MRFSSLRTSFVPVALLALACGQSAPAGVAPASTRDDGRTVDTLTLRAAAAFLSSDALQGRGTGTEGGRVAAAYFGVPVLRRPTPGMVTVAGGGFVASGPHGADRQPLPWAPPALHLTGLEGAGEVQTPLTGPAAATLRVGDTVWFRHAKSGELFEHSQDVHLLAGDAIVETVPTYRGTGHAFG